MYDHATHLLYDAAGRPDMQSEEHESACACCGAASLHTCPAPFSDVFTDWDKLARPDSIRVCPACAFAFFERVPMEGREKLQRMRTYSHVVAAGKWHIYTKGDKDAIRSILLDPPDGAWMCAIAESGQKHVLFRASVNTGKNAYHVQFEETSVFVRRDAFVDLVSHVEALYVYFSKAAIESGEYLALPKIINQYGPQIIDEWDHHEQYIRRYRPSRMLDLALFVARKEEPIGRDDTAPYGDGACLDHPPVDRLGRVAVEGADLLEHTPGSSGGQRVHRRPSEVAQLSLFTDGDT